jgi:catechol 2,3-dioxygenase-like lactoylglutathione lyase family enzyme
MPTLSGLHHVSFPVTDLERATSWFETVFGARRLADLDHYDEQGGRYAVVLTLPGLAPLALLRHAQQAPELSPMALGVADQVELANWAAHFDEHGVAHSDVMPARGGFAMTCTMPGGPMLLFYAGRGLCRDAVALSGQGVDPAQTAAFLRHAQGHRLYPLYHLIAFRGRRRGEACGLRRADTDLDTAVTTVRWQITQLGCECHRTALRLLPGDARGRRLRVPCLQWPPARPARAQARRVQ